MTVLLAGLFVAPGLVPVAMARGSGGTSRSAEPIRRRLRIPVVGADLDDLDIMSRTIWGEARGEPYAGKLAVGFVIKERAELARLYRIRFPKARRHALYGEGDVASACLAPYQFSAWNQNDPNLRKMLGAHKTEEWPDCLRAATEVMLGTQPNNCGHATHYHSIRIFPRWAKGQMPAARIANHQFYKLTD